MGWLLLISIILTYIFGGLWWLITIIIGLLWIANAVNKSEQDSKTPTNNSSASTVPSENSDSNDVTSRDIKDINLSFGISKDRLVDICKRYSGPDFYVLERIPSNKLDKYKKNYPTPYSGELITLFNCNIHGSACEGFAIGEYGISWKTSESSKSYNMMTWAEFKYAHIREEMCCCKIGNEAISLSGCSFNKQQFIDLLKMIQREIVASNIIGSNTDNTHNIPSLSGIKEPSLNTVFDYPLDINTADYDALLSLPGIGAVEAKRLIDYRQQHGPFIEINVATEFLKMKPHHVKQWEGKVIVSASTSDLPIQPGSDQEKTKGGRTID